MYSLTGQKYLSVLNDSLFMDEILKIAKTNNEKPKQPEVKEYANFFDYAESESETESESDSEQKVENSQNFTQEWTQMINDSDSDSESDPELEINETNEMYQDVKEEINEDTISTRITVTNEVLYKELEHIMQTTKVVVGLHDVFVHFKPVTEYRIKKELVMLCYFSQRVEIETEFMVSFSALKRYITLNYGINIFKSIIRSEDPQQTLLQSKTIMIKNKNEIVKDSLVKPLHDKLKKIKLTDIEIFNEETGPLKVPTEEEYDEFLQGLQHRPFRYTASEIDSSFTPLMHSL